MFGINRFSLFWILIGLLPFLLIWTIIPKQGNILVFHVFYFASIGLCLWMGTFRLRWVVILIFLFSGISFYQGQFWTTEADLLRHTHRLECWPRTVVAQQLLMKYEEDIPAIKEMEVSTHDPLIKAMWLRRLGLIYFTHNDLAQAQEYFLQSLGFNPMNVDILNALAVVCHERGQEDESLVFLKRSFEINPTYPDTLRTLGIYYYIHKDLSQARGYLTRCLFYDPNNTQARELLRLANPTN